MMKRLVFFLLIASCACEAQYYRKARFWPSGGTRTITTVSSIFTDDFQGFWTDEGGKTPNIVTTQYNTGTSSLEAPTMNWEEIDLRYNGWTGTDFNAVFTTYDSLRFWAKCSTGTSAVHVKSYSTGYSQTGNTTDISVTTTWREYAIPKQSGDVWYFILQIEAGTVYFDDIRLTSG